MNCVKTYVACASLYGSFRAGMRVDSMNVLPGTKLLTIGMGGLYGTCLLPIYIINDINRMYMSKNNLKYSDYGYPDKDERITDILFK